MKDELKKELIEFLEVETGIPFEEASKFTGEKAKALFDKFIDIELQELQNDDEQVSRRCELACMWQDIISRHKIAIGQ